MVGSVVLLLVGLAAVVVGADLAVDGGRRIARAFGWSELLIGLTITSIGTSLPELATSTTAAIASGGDGGPPAAALALGHVLGSNLFLLTALLGLTGLLVRLDVPRRSVQREGTVIAIGMLLVLLFALGGQIGRLEGVLLLVMYAAYLGMVVRQELAAARAAAPEPPPPPTARQVQGAPGPTLAPTDLSDEIAEALGEAPPAPGKPGVEPAPTVAPEHEAGDWRRDALRLLAGVVVVGLAAQLVVDRGVLLATAIGLSGVVIGTGVAVGTSIPEVVVSVRAAARGATELGVGNLLGSAVTNLLLCLGAAALAHPLTVAAEVLTFDWVFVAVATAVSLLVLHDRRDLTRAEGAALLMLFGLYGYLRVVVV